jgi:hypothetical protein
MQEKKRWRWCQLQSNQQTTRWVEGRQRWLLKAMEEVKEKNIRRK